MGYRDIPLYGEIAKWTYSFMLESFTFISGYIFIYSAQKKGLCGFKELISKKWSRLLLPMLVFGTIYFFIFNQYETFGSFIYEIINGTGHLWYLIMLFWCFVEAWFLIRINIDERIKLLGLLLLAIFCSWMSIPFRIATSFYYLFFFYLPVVFVNRREKNLAFVQSKNMWLVLSWSIFIVSFVLIKYLIHLPKATECTSVVSKALFLSLNNTMQMIYATLGVLAFYLTAMSCAGTVEPFNKNAPLVKVGECCFGVYIFQQFVLKAVYYKTNIPGIVGASWLPWIGAAIALLLSFVITYIIRKTKFGRSII